MPQITEGSKLRPLCPRGSHARSPDLRGRPGDKALLSRYWHRLGLAMYSIPREARQAMLVSRMPKQQTAHLTCFESMPHGFFVLMWPNEYVSGSKTEGLTPAVSRTGARSAEGTNKRSLLVSA